jgi:SAM-dependent methyltransferase
MKRIKYRKRICDICANSEFEEISQYKFNDKTRNNVFQWHVRNVVCLNCGFAFVSPAPTDESLQEYYGDSFSIYPNMVLDYSIENRLHIITKYLKRGSGNSYVEIGSNTCPEFQSKLSKYVEEVTNVELNESCDSNYVLLSELPSEAGDIIASYFVLEHIPRPRNFLTLCSKALRDSGTLIIEVPNLHLYPKEPAGLILHEHVNHFSPLSLTRLAALCNLKLIEISQTYCSRPFGFVAVFQKASGINELIISDKAELHYAKACMLEGTYQIKKFKETILAIRSRINDLAERNEPVIIWGANGMCLRLLEDYELPKSATVLDMDPRKRDYLNPIEVRQPNKTLDIIKRCRLVVINTPRHADEIEHWILNNTGRTLLEDEVVVVNYI